MPLFQIVPEHDPVVVNGKPQAALPAHPIPCSVTVPGYRDGDGTFEPGTEEGIQVPVGPGGIVEIDARDVRYLKKTHGFAFRGPLKDFEARGIRREAIRAANEAKSALKRAAAADVAPPNLKVLREAVNEAKGDLAQATTTDAVDAIVDTFRLGEFAVARDAVMASRQGGKDVEDLWQELASAAKAKSDSLKKSG